MANLTREQIENLEAGPELDAAIHEDVMGLQLQNHSILKHGGVWVGCRYVDPPPAYSTDIAAAWGVIEKTGMLDVSRLRYALWQEDDGGNWVVTMDAGRYVEAPTAQLAICRAAMLWKLEQEQTQ